MTNRRRRCGRCRSGEGCRQRLTCRRQDGRIRCGCKRWCGRFGERRDREGGGDAGDGRFGSGGDSGGTGGFDHAEIASDQFRLECSGSGDGGTDLVVPAEIDGFEFLGDLP